VTAPAADDFDVRVHQLTTWTNESAARRGALSIRLPDAKGKGAGDASKEELAREKVMRHELVGPGPDKLALLARRLGDSDQVHIRIEAAKGGAKAITPDPNLVAPLPPECKKVELAVLGDDGRTIEIDLDGDKKSNLRLVHTIKATARDAEQLRSHIFNAYDPQGVLVDSARHAVLGKPVAIPAALDDGVAPAPKSAPLPADRAAAQGDVPLEASVAIKREGGDIELRIDGDGDRRKELALRFHTDDADAGAGLRKLQISVVQLSSGTAHTFTEHVLGEYVERLQPVVAAVADGHGPAVIEVARGLSDRTLNLTVHPPIDDSKGRYHRIEIGQAVALAVSSTHNVQLPADKMSGTLATDIKANEQKAGVWSTEVSLGEGKDRFLFTLEKAPGGLTFGVAALAPEGPVGNVGIRVNSAAGKLGLAAVDAGPTSIGFDIDGDGKADIVIHDGIAAPRDTPASVERCHELVVHGPVVNGETRAKFLVSHGKFNPQGCFPVRGNRDDLANREAAGAASTATTIAKQEKEGSNIAQLLLRYEAGISAQVKIAADNKLLSAPMFEAWRKTSEDMVLLKVEVAAKSGKEGEIAGRASASAATLHAELVAATVGREEEIYKPDDDPSPARKVNPYTGATFEKESIADITSWKQVDAGPAAGLSGELGSGKYEAAFGHWDSLRGGVERWARKRIEEHFGKGSKQARECEYVFKMAERLRALQPKEGARRVFATFLPDASFRNEKSYHEHIPLHLYLWKEGGDWKLRDITNPERIFDCSAEGGAEPPAALFQQLDDKAAFPKGVIRYQIPDGAAGQVVCREQKKWHEWVAEAALVLAAIGLAATGVGLVVEATAVSVVASTAFAASALTGAVAAAGDLHDGVSHGWADGAMIALNILQIASGVTAAGAIVTGSLVKGATAAAAAGKNWTGGLARIASMSAPAYVPLTGAAMAADVATVAVMGGDLLEKLKTLESSTAPQPDKDRAKTSLIIQFAVMGGLTALSVKGDLPTLKSGGASIVLDTINGVPVAHAGGVHLNGTAIKVNPNDPNAHATARWASRSLDPALAADKEFSEWYTAWLAREQKVKLRPDGTPEVVKFDLDGKPMPKEIEAKLNGIARRPDFARSEAAWARAADLEALRRASGGLDIDPTAPSWPAERKKLVDKLGGNRQAEELVARYEAMRLGGMAGDGKAYAAQHGKLTKAIPESEIEGINRLFPEHEVYVSGMPEGGAVHVVIVAKPGTPPDLMGAIEQRAKAARVRPDPDFARARGMGPNDTLGLDAKVVTPDQFFGLATAKVKGAAPLDLHRIDQQVGPGGKAYSRAELEAMYKAGYEFDKASGQFVLRPEASRAGAAGRAVELGNHVVVGSALPSRAVGEEVLQKLAQGDAQALRVVGVDPGKLDPKQTEWGVGQRKDGTFVLVRGDHGAVDWNQMPGVTPLGHSHPVLDPMTRKLRELKGPAGRGVTIAELRAGGSGERYHELVYLFPSQSDLAVASEHGKHTVATPYAHLGEGRIGIATEPGQAPVVIHILEAAPAGLLFEGSPYVIYQGKLKITAGGETLWEGSAWIGNSGIGSVIDFAPPKMMGKLPEGVKPGTVYWDPKAPPAGATGSGKVDPDLALIEQARTQTLDERQKILGADPARGYLPHEGEVGAMIEARYGYFKRDESKASEWIGLSGPFKGKSFDLLGMPPGKGKYLNMDKFKKSIDHHVIKQIDHPVIDLRELDEAQRKEVKDYVNATHSAHVGRIFYVE
jgi:hypothetical protein